MPGRMELRTADGVRLSALHVPGRGDTAVVVAHGFSGSLRKPGLQAVVAGLSAYAGVLAVESRGHGRSGGRSTMGDREVLDVDAAVARARELGYRQVATCGWSMGGSAVLRHAALHGTELWPHLGPPLRLRTRPDAVISVSATSRWWVRDTERMRRLHWLVEQRSGRAVTRTLLRTRLARRWDVVPASPIEVVARIAPTPLLLVHGERDEYFPVEHPQALAAAAGQPSELWLLPGLGHAEAAATPELLARLGAHLHTLLQQADASGVPA